LSFAPCLFQRKKQLCLNKQGPLGAEDDHNHLIKDHFKAKEGLFEAEGNHDHLTRFF